MIKGKNILALIPARGGSKGIIKKNIKNIAGKPLIYWTIKEALKSKYIDELIVSSDDPQIIEISKKYGAKAPFIRPSLLSTNTAKGIDVYIHAIKYFISQRIYFSYILILQPTSPLRTYSDIDGSIEYLMEKQAKAIVSVCEVEHHPLWTNTLPKDKNMSKFIHSDYQNKNRQELPIYYRLNGAIYIAETNYILQNQSFYFEKCFAFIMPQEKSIDIDTKLDFKIAEILLLDRSQNK